jgi:RNA polymerase sigma-70 factor (ECF subfamily)
MLAIAFSVLAGGPDDVPLADDVSSPGDRGHRRVVVSANLVARLRARDRAAYDELLRRTFEPLVAIAVGIVGSQDAAEDVVQDVMVWVWEQGASWAPGASPAAYLIGAVRHRALNVVRARGVEARYRERVEREDASGTTGSAPHAAATDWATERRDLEVALQQALAGLTERQRTAFLLRVEQQQTVPEVAATLGIGVRGAEKLVSRAMRVVRDALLPLMQE